MTTTMVRLLMWATGAWAWAARTVRPASPGARGPVWPPRPGDRIEMFSRHSRKWFPAVVESSEPNPGGGWPLLATRLLGNVAGDELVLEGEVRPLDWLAAARRDPVRFPEDYPAWCAFDLHAAEHMDECPGCPECPGLDAHYPACPECGHRRHRDDGDPCICGRYPWLREREEAGARLAMATRRIRGGLNPPPAPAAASRG